MTLQPCKGFASSAAVREAEAAHHSLHWDLQAACGPLTSTCTVLTSAEGRAVAVAHEVDVQAILEADSQQLSRTCAEGRGWVHLDTCRSPSRQAVLQLA